MQRMISASTLGILSTSIAAAQPCTPDWNTAIGNPGCTGGYVAPIVPWDDGSGQRLYVGGSFTRAGGLGTADYIARWNRSTNTWSALGSGISPGSTNAYVTAIQPFDFGAGERLVVGGQWARAGTPVNTASLAMWTGTDWQEMGTGWYSNGSGTVRGVVWSMAVWNNLLYVGGQLFPPGAGVPGGALATWDGGEWAAIPSTLSGFSPAIFGMAVFDDGSGAALFAGGRFDSINGQPIPGLARWNGSTWSQVGGGLTVMSSIMGIYELIVFDDGSGPALYASAYNLRIPGQPAPGGFTSCQVIRWDGQNWSQVGGQWLGTGIVEAFAAFDDGTGEALYIGGQALPDIHYFNKLENGTWVPVGGGFTAVAPPWPGVFGLGAWGDTLYVGGIFTDQEGPAATNIVGWQGCATTCVGDLDTDGDVDLQDLAFLLADFGTGNPEPEYGDIDGDGDVDLQDLAFLLAEFGVTC
jgi:hypothetical protein